MYHLILSEENLLGKYNHKHYCQNILCYLIFVNKVVVGLHAVLLPSCLNLLSSFRNSYIFDLCVILSIITTPFPLSGRSMTMSLLTLLLFFEDSLFFQNCSCRFAVAILRIGKVWQVRSDNDDDDDELFLRYGWPTKGV